MSNDGKHTIHKFHTQIDTQQIMKITISTTVIFVIVQTNVNAHANIPSKFPSIEPKMISGDLLLEPMIVRAIKHVKESVLPSILNIPVSVYNSKEPNVPYYKGLALENSYNVIRKVVRAIADTNLIPEDIYTCNGHGMSYDDGPSEDTSRLLDALKKKNIKSTFFVIGTSGIQNVDMIKRMDKEGHEIGIHTWTHYPLTSLTNEQIVAEIKYSESLVYAATGRVTKSLRPPYGNVDDRVRAIAFALGYNIIMWTKDSKDTYDTPENITNTLFQWSNETQGFISLQHSMSKQTIDHAIEALEYKRRLHPKPVGDCNVNDEGNWYWETKIEVLSRFNFTEYLEQENSFRVLAGIGEGNVYTGEKPPIYSSGEKVTSTVLCIVLLLLLL